MQKNTQPSNPPAWDDVRYFLAVARAGSLSGAAKVLGVEHSTVARRVDALEASLGLHLFLRRPRGWVLSQEGEALLPQGESLEAEAQAFLRSARMKPVMAGVVRLSVPPVIGSHFLVPQLAPLLAQHPALQLEVVGESREANLFRGEADLALRLSRPQAPGLIARLLGQMGYGLYGTRAFADAAPDRWRFVAYEQSLQGVPQQQWLDNQRQGRPVALLANDLASLYQAARAGIGVAVLPHFLGQTDALLCPLPCTGPPPAPRKLWLVMHPDLRRSARVRRVADFMAEVVAAAEALLNGPTDPGITDTKV